MIRPVWFWWCWAWYCSERELDLLTPWFRLCISDGSMDFLLRARWYGWKLWWWPRPGRSDGEYCFSCYVDNHPLYILNSDEMELRSW
jgi:hypothetical protein